MDNLHYFTYYVKFGLGRASYDASQEIRTGKITREERVALVNKYDSEVPSKYLQDMLKYMDINEDKFWEVIDNNRAEKLWQKNGNKWELKNPVS